MFVELEGKKEEKEWEAAGFLVKSFPLTSYETLSVKRSFSQRTRSSACLRGGEGGRRRLGRRMNGR